MRVRLADRTRRRARRRDRRRRGEDADEVVVEVAPRAQGPCRDRRARRVRLLRHGAVVVADVLRDCIPTKTSNAATRATASCCTGCGRNTKAAAVRRTARRPTSPTARPSTRALAFMPSRSLVNHEWRAHGACTGLEPGRAISRSPIARSPRCTCRPSCKAPEEAVKTTTRCAARRVQARQPGPQRRHAEPALQPRRARRSARLPRQGSRAAQLRQAHAIALSRDRDVRAARLALTLQIDFAAAWTMKRAGLIGRKVARS